MLLLLLVGEVEVGGVSGAGDSGLAEPNSPILLPLRIQTRLKLISFTLHQLMLLRRLLLLLKIADLLPRVLLGGRRWHLSTIFQEYDTLQFLLKCFLLLFERLIKMRRLL